MQGRDTENICGCFAAPLATNVRRGSTIWVRRLRSLLDRQRMLCNTRRGSSSR